MNRMRAKAARHSKSARGSKDRGFKGSVRKLDQLELLSIDEEIEELIVVEEDSEEIKNQTYMRF